MRMPVIRTVGTLGVQTVDNANDCLAVHVCVCERERVSASLCVCQCVYVSMCLCLCLCLRGLGRATSWTHFAYLSGPGENFSKSGLYSVFHINLVES